jgi:ligand-binding SRPBCC domain-containing protein
MPIVEASISVACTVEQAFDFLCQIENYPKIVPEDLQLRIVQAPQKLGLGAQFEVQIVGFGVPQTVVYEITEFARPDRFSESQVRGPLPRYVHSHEFLAEDGSRVRITDRIEFEPPGGMLSFLLPVDRLQSSLEQGLVHRHRELKRLLEGK